MNNSLFKSIVAGFFLIVSFTAPACAQEATTPEEIGEAFIRKVYDGKVDEAFNDVWSPEVQALMGTGLITAKGTMSGFIQLFGSMEGLELIRKEEYSDRVVRLVYFAYTSDIPIVFDLYFYLSEDGWGMVNMKSDTDFDNLAVKKSP